MTCFFIDDGMLKTLALKTIVIKIGTKVLASKRYSLDTTLMKALVDQLSAIVRSGVKVVVVSSGAICSGMGLLGLRARPAVLAKLQACAAIGQAHLMQVYDNLFRSHNILTAQILLTGEDLNDRKRYLNAKATLQALLEEGVVPVINENDTVSTDEIKFGDNDRLSSLVANLLGADLLVLLSDVDGLYEYDGRRVNKGPVAVVDKITNQTEAMAQKAADELGTGGMVSKLEAAKIATSAGIPCIIANGKREDVLNDILNRKAIGTLFLPAVAKMTARKRWLGFSAKTRGRLIVDDGAREALVKRNKSLLASGIISSSGDFKRGEIVGIADLGGREFARGITNYSQQEINGLKGLKTTEIPKVLGYKNEDEIVHKDNLVIL